ncbi:transcriptional regulator, MarR family [Parvibaculum lavamentivorans DS-1]|uniref:Transcriptional regulator, MarR family n=1 Tax=Parvibaculum lavamentivorans (strain DS-1 / DSM 13023 / NCIMB 13966) TaxID=402881 RepID=A7HX63_PARL1|nr:MarR family transcriptional regulator [Parvibaculum lavamentivorans]ABS64496.1 transcriptional regulator, MarR family [Parvibaculum lavamentivorans DS-1]
MSQTKNTAVEVADTAGDDLFLPDHFLKAINDVGTMLATIYDRRTGLTRNQTRIVIALLETDGQTQTELANALSIHKVSVGIYLNELESLGLVERRIHPTDGRAKCIYLTPLLHASKHIARDHYAAIHSEAIAGINEKDYIAMLRCMDKMRKNLEVLDTKDRKARRKG